MNLKSDGNSKDAENLFSVLTLNLRFGLADDGVNSWKYRKKSYPSLLKKHGKDFIGFQEANDFQIDYIDNLLTEYNFIGQRKPSPDFWQNNIIFYKKPWECIYKTHFFLSPTPTVPSRSRKSLWPRQCTIGMFKNKNRRLICVNTHFDFEKSVQIESAGMIVEMLSKLPPDVPVILMGDFNATPSSACYLFLTEKNQGEIKPYFKNAFQKPYPATHHGFTGSRNGDHIDWILYRGVIVPKTSNVLMSPVGEVYPSDHFPICATFAWEDTGR